MIINHPNKNGHMRRYVVRGDRVSVLAEKGGQTFERDLTTESEMKHRVLRMARSLARKQIRVGEA